MRGFVIGGSLSRSFFAIVVIAGTAGCFDAPRQEFGGAPAQSPMPVLSRYIERYGAITSPSIDSYARGLIGRLVSAVPASERKDYTMAILDTTTPIAFTPGGGYIIISKGIIRNLSREGELAFIVAHEIAHEALHHTKSDTLYSTDSKIREALELQADQFASVLLSRSGFDPADGLAALRDAHRGLAEEQYSSVYPEAGTRAESLASFISRSAGVGPEYTQDSDEFRRFQNLVGRSGGA